MVLLVVVPVDPGCVVLLQHDCSHCSVETVNCSLLLLCTLVKDCVELYDKASSKHGTIYPFGINAPSYRDATPPHRICARASQFT